MSEKQFLVPREGLIVRDPVTKNPLAEAGEYKPWIGPEGRYWRRREICGEVVVGSPPVIEEVQYYKKGK